MGRDEVGTIYQAAITRVTTLLAKGDKRWRTALGMSNQEFAGEVEKATYDVVDAFLRAAIAEEELIRLRHPVWRFFTGNAYGRYRENLMMAYRRMDKLREDYEHA
jgi:hypothetical protein